MPASPTDRASLRKQLIAAREALSPAEHAALSARICKHLTSLLSALAGDTLTFCWPYRAEPDVRLAVLAWLAEDAKRRACLPAVIDKGAALQFRHWLPDAPMAPDACGIPAPVGTELLRPTLLLVPVNGFDARGYRLGYGGGYFDRTLAGMTPAPETIAIGFELARLRHLDPEPHDLPLGWLVTEDGAFRAER